jgi:MYXO-CTERM domain-containing protein
MLAIAIASLLSAPAFAEDGEEPTSDSDLSDAETSYSGAQILTGDVNATFEGYREDYTRGKYEQKEYAYWAGNTLYMGAEDEHGNGVDAIVEFFWFESSIDRGSDFYVAVIKARTTPNVTEEWYLMEDDEDAVLQVSAQTNIGRGTNAFRWDWSLPFENYGMDSYGQVTMKSSYGLGGNSEGSAMAAKKVTDEETGATAEVSVQTKGYVNADYSVNTEYSVNLWSWYTRVRGEPGEMTWDVTLDNNTKKEENAYHEYFLVMQATEDETFIIDELTVGAHTDQWWWGIWNQYGVTVEGIELNRPDWEPEDEDTGDLWDTGGEEEEEEEEENEDSGADRNDDLTDDPSRGGINPLNGDGSEGSGCSSAPGAGLGLGLALLGAALVGRRRRS